MFFNYNIARVPSRSHSLMFMHFSKSNSITDQDDHILLELMDQLQIRKFDDHFITPN